mmetsp:Transcript_48679/g.95431  ORF Transcript_48679/g.95431 Transcript_48679/m.95431 type:complete len:210 (+) Transcript_48679:655-1284(+)
MPSLIDSLKSLLMWLRKSVSLDTITLSVCVLLLTRNSVTRSQSREPDAAPTMLRRACGMLMSLLTRLGMCSSEWNWRAHLNKLVNDVHSCAGLLACWGSELMWCNLADRAKKNSASVQSCCSMAAASKGRQPAEARKRSLICFALPCRVLLCFRASLTDGSTFLDTKEQRRAAPCRSLEPRIVVVTRWIRLELVRGETAGLSELQKSAR